MNPIRIVASAVLVVATILSGCATVNLGDPNRPLPVQPVIPEEVKARLKTHPLKSIPISFGTVTYYDVSWVLGKKEGEFNFTKDSPQINKPSANTVVAAFKFLKAFSESLKSEGYTVSDEPAGSPLRLRLDVDFATMVIKPDSPSPTTVIFARPRVYFNGIEVLRSSDDRLAAGRQGILSPKGSAEDKAYQLAAFGSTRELERAWGIAIRGEEVPAK